MAYKPNDEQIATLSPYLNKEIECEIIGYANDGLNEGYEVRLPDNLPYFNKATPHITISTSKKSKPVKTGYMNFQSIDKTFTLKGKVILVQW